MIKAAQGCVQVDRGPLWDGKRTVTADGMIGAAFHFISLQHLCLDEMCIRDRSRDESFDTGNGETVNGVAPLVDIYELDWYSGSELRGISLAMVLSAETTGFDENGDIQSVTISDERCV